MVRLFRQFDTPASPPPAAPVTRPAPPPPPPPPAPLDRDMPPLGGPGWVPEGWKARLLMGLLVVGLIGASAAALYQTVGPPAHELRAYRAGWAALTPAQREAVNQWIQAAGK